MSWTFEDTDDVEELKRRILFLQSSISQRSGNGFMPTFVPWLIRLPKAVRSNLLGINNKVEAGTYQCQSNKWGAISVIGLDGILLGIHPDECVVLHMTQNPHLIRKESA